MTDSLCESCSHMREIVSGKGSRFLLCQLAQDDARFAKYPPQPMIRCEGWSRVVTEPEWLASTDAWSMLQAVQRSAPSERKVRLWNAAICRRFWDYLPAASQAVLVE